MITTPEIYKRYLLKVNKNDSNEGINILPSLFVLMFNSEALVWLGEKLRDESDNIKLDQLDTLFLSDVPLTKLTTGPGWIEFQLPESFYRHSSSFALVDKENCKGVQVFYFEKKSLGFSAYLADDFSKAHFDFEEAPFIITQGKLKAYTDEYEITSMLTSYYKTPIQVDMAGYTKIDGTPSKNVNCELSLQNIDEILNRLTLETYREYENAEGVGYAKDRIISEP